MSTVAKRKAFDITYLLKPLAHKPHSHPTLYIDDMIVVVKDKFPKSDSIHQLILPRINDSKDVVPKDIGEVRRQHLPLLYAMHDYYTNKMCITDLPNNSTQSQLKIGFHALPSIPFLHAHIIDTQNILQSPHTKLKRHYNSFTTDFFIDLSHAIHDLECTSMDRDNINGILGRGSVGLREGEYYEGCLKGELRCMIEGCGERRKTFSELKKHHQQTHFIQKQG